jgi:4-carboxymuconolactone decarboxylase
MPNSTDYEKGAEIRRKLTGGHVGQAAEAVAEMVPDFEKILVEVVFGKVWARPGLELKMRSVATISALVAQQRLPQLKAHIAYGLNAGLTKEEIIEILIQIAFYAGIPASMNAFYLAKEVFDEKGL